MSVVCFVFLFSILCIVLFIVPVLFCVLFLLLCCLFPIFIQDYRPLPPAGNPTAEYNYLHLRLHICLRLHPSPYYFSIILSFGIQLKMTSHKTQTIAHNDKQTNEKYSSQKTSCFLLNLSNKNSIYFFISVVHCCGSNNFPAMSFINFKV